MNKKLKGTVLAAAVAGLFLSGSAQAAGEEKKEVEAKGVRCMGVNSCSGKGGCGTADHACAGKNSCKGKGWVKVESEKECTDKGGKVVVSQK